MPRSTKVETEQFGDVLKSSEEMRVVWGYASVISEAGVPVVDSQGDMIAEDVLVKSAHEFMRSHRRAKVLHAGEQVGEVVESLVLTTELQKSLGVDAGRVGWVIAMHIADDDVWARVQKGELKAFSVGGRGVRVNA